MKKENVWKILDMLYEENKEAVKEWIHSKWPHGYGLYE